MKLYEAYVKALRERNIKEDNYKVTEGDFYTSVTYHQLIGGDTCQIKVCFYDDENVIEIYVGKQIKVEDKLEVLEKINELNCEYTWVTFFLTENEILYLRSTNEVHGDVQEVIRRLLEDMQLANKHFYKFGGK